MKKNFLVEIPNWILLGFVLDSFLYRNNSVTLYDVLNFVWDQCLKHKCTSLYDYNKIVHCLDHLEDIKHISWCYSDDDASIIYSRNDLGTLSKI